MTNLSVELILTKLEDIVPAEISADSFHRHLAELAQWSNLKTYLEIGSSSGEGSTSALTNGLRARSDSSDVSLFCMEISRARFEALSKCYKSDSFVKCFNVSSVPSAEFPSIAELEYFYKSIRYKYKQRKAQQKLKQALEFYKQDLDYVKASSCDLNGIQLIKKEQNICVFDFVLIDGSEFTGERELFEIMGAKVIALDDINTFKCWNAHRILSSHSGYSLLYRSRRVRNGYSIFKRNF